MAEPTDQQVVVDGQWNRFDWRRRAAVSLFGERKARVLARPMTLARGWLDDSLTTSGRVNRSHIRQFKNRRPSRANVA